MQRFLITFAALAVGATMIAAGPAAAKGNGGAEQRAKLKQELAEARARNADSGPSFFESLFGTDDAQSAGTEGKTGTQ